MLGPIFEAVFHGLKCACGWIPVVFAAALFAEAYYAYVFVFCSGFVTETVLRVVLAGVFHILLLFCLWSFAQTTLTSPSSVPRYFQISGDERRQLTYAARSPARRDILLEAMATKRGVLTRCTDGKVNYCDACQRIKPDRCHHCSSCEKCIPKMDHHCPWFNNCIGFSTYKFFLLTLFYLVLLCAYVAASMPLYMWHRAPNERSLSYPPLHSLFLLVLAGAMFFAIGCFLCMHASFVMANCTTLESTRPATFKERGDSFNIGVYRNVVESLCARAVQDIIRGGRIVRSTTLLWARQLYIILWKNIYVKRISRHYPTTVLEIALIVALLLGIQEDSVVREPLVRRGDTTYEPIHPKAFWNAQPNMSRIDTVHYPQRLISQPEGPVAEDRFPEMNTLLPVMGALQQRHLLFQAERFKYAYPVPEVTLQRFPFPAHLEYRDTKNYALVLTRFCIGMLIPFSVFVARLTDEKATGMKEMLRVTGLGDWIYWASHYLSGFFMHLIIVTLMMLFVCVKRNEEGRAFIQFSDPLLLFWILMCFCSNCQMHAILLSMFFGSLEQGANWSNFYDRSATPDNVTLAEIVFVGFLCDCCIVIIVWYLDNVLPVGPGISKPFLFPFQTKYWIPSMTFARMPLKTVGELQNFEPEPRDQLVAIEVINVSKVIIMDEPTANMDPEARREMWELLLKIRRSCSIFLTTQHLDEADVLGDRIVIMANGQIRCGGSPTFLKQRFGTGYRMKIHKLPGCKLLAIELLLRKYSPKARLQSDSDNEATFILGQMVATRKIVTMFKDIEQRSAELGIASVGVAVTSLEDVIVQVGEEHHVHHRHPDIGSGEYVEANMSVVKTMASATVSDPSFLGRAWAVLQKRAIYVWRQKKMPLFSWMLPPLLLSLLFLLEYLGLRVSGYDVEHFGDKVRYTFPEVVGRAEGFVVADKEQAFIDDQLHPLIGNPAEFYVKSLDADTNITAGLLAEAKDRLHKYVFRIHFGVQMTKKEGDVLWYNGQIQHTAPLVMRLYNTARLRNITGVKTAEFVFEVSSRGAEDRHLLGEEVGLEKEQISSQNTYRTVLPKVLRSIFFPLVSSLMCSNFVLFPTTERALRVCPFFLCFPQRALFRRPPLMEV
ncbi:hypothetical protein V5799_005143 [Amblyomma americanum]|uniref:Palmitoyltransferase n=1 Tax=Amblyomma americanum TaxID=6943 RepID=A0AAQ4E036_AMBAM